MTQGHAELEQKFENLREKDPKDAAEHAFALAVLNQREGNRAQAEKFKQETIDLLDKCPTETMADCAQRNMIIAGVIIPDLVHQDVVRDRLQSIGL